VRRVLAGESVSAVAQELGIRRKRLYVWKDRYAELGEAGLVHRRGGKPRKVVSEAGDEAEANPAAPSPQTTLPGSQSLSQENCP
jgi:transposase